MKAVGSSEPGQGHHHDFYTTMLAPVNRHGELNFRAVDAVVLVVLFLEVAAVMRLLLAN